MERRLSEAYGAFAFAYDQGLGRPFFRGLEPLLRELLERYPVPRGSSLLDIACGSGLALRFFREQGFRTFGIDASIPMLTAARASRARLVAADMRLFHFRRRFDLLTCFYDSLNHLLDHDELVAAFRSMSRSLAPSGRIWFDTNHETVYPRVWGLKEPFVSAGSGYRLVIDTRYDEGTRIARAEVSGWARGAGGTIEIEETHVQRAYSEGEIDAALDAAGLRTIESFSFDPYREGEDGEVKTFRIAAAS